MAIHDDNNVQQSASTESTMSKAFADAQPKKQQGSTKPSFSFRNMGNLTQVAMGRTPASEVLSKLTKALTEVYAEAADSKAFEISLIPVDINNTVELSVSVLVVAVRIRQSAELGVAYHTLIIEGSIEQPQPRMEMINGVNTEILKTIGDANDATMRQVVMNYVSKNFPNVKSWYAETCVVPRGFNVTDQQAIFNLASNAITATTTELQIHAVGFEDLNLSHAVNDSNLSIRTTFGNPSIINAVGLPVRSDVQIDFSAAPITSGQNHNQAVERVSNISRVSGFMDLIWAPQDAVQNAYYQQMPNNYHRYLARFVMTSLESVQLLTVPAQLLALVTALSLQENNKWVQAFRNKDFASSNNIHDIGAIGIEVNFENNASGVSKRINTNLDSFKQEHLHKLVASTIRPGMVLSLDVPECSSDTWYNGIFGAAAQGNQHAYDAIYNAAQILTNGSFKRHFQPGDPMMTPDLDRVHSGYYNDGTGVQKDIREIDYLAIMNLIGEKDPNIIREWSDTFNKTQYPIELRLAGRKRILTGLLSDVTFTGFATRVTFHPAFTTALVTACRDVGLQMRTVDTYADLGSFERAGYNFTGQSMLSGESSGLFNRNFGGAAPGFVGASRGFVNRW